MSCFTAPHNSSLNLLPMPLVQILDSTSTISYWSTTRKVRQNEYAVSAQGISTTGATPGEWGSVTLEIVNTGNISDSFIPTLEGLPASWNAYYSRPSGTSFDPLGGLIALPGSPAAFSIQIQPDENASIGFQQMSVNISSSQYPEVYTVLPIQFLVKADRIPVIVPPSVRPSCPPSYTCTLRWD